MARNGSRFLAAFNDIEDHFRRELGMDQHSEFMGLAREYAKRRHLNRAQLDALSSLALLRNAIAHGRYYSGEPIAEPVAGVVLDIEKLRDFIKKPPTALSVVGQSKVFSVSPEDPVSSALEIVTKHDFSQMPIYDGAGRYKGILTTNTIARWLAGQLAKHGGYAESENISTVMSFTEPHEQALPVPRSMEVTEALHRLLRGGDAGQPVTR